MHAKFSLSLFLPVLGEPFENRIAESLAVVDLAWSCMSVAESMCAAVTDHKVLYHHFPLFYDPDSPRYLLNNTGVPAGMSSSDFLQSKPNFCAYLYSHDAPDRVAIFQAARQFYKPCDALGASQYTGPPRNFDRWTGNFYEAAIVMYQSYRFVIAGENTGIAGYMSEKVALPVFARALVHTIHRISSTPSYLLLISSVSVCTLYFLCGM